MSRLLRYFALLLAATFAFSGGLQCDVSFAQEPEPEPEFLDTDRYFPLEEDVLYVYRLALLEKVVEVRIGDDGDAESSYFDNFYLYRTRANPLGPGTYFDVVAEVDYDSDTSAGFVFDGNRLLGKLSRWGAERGSYDLPLITQVLPPEPLHVGQQWDLEMNPLISMFPPVAATGTVVGLEDAAALEDSVSGSQGYREGVLYEDCLKVEYTVTVDFEFDEGWFHDQGEYIRGEAIATLWFAPDVGLVRGNLRIEELDTNSNWFVNLVLFGRDDLAVLELISRLPLDPAR